MTFIPAEHAWYLLAGAWGTIKLSFWTFLGGGAVGLLLALARVAPRRAAPAGGGLHPADPGHAAAGADGPVLLRPQPVRPGRAVGAGGAALAMTIYSSAFLGEIWRGCIQAVPRNQWEAAECLGLSRLQRMGKVILPQALRIATPPTVGFLVQIIKNTSIASLVIGYSELAYNAKILNNSTFQPFIYFGCAAILYFAMCYPLSRWSRYLERKLNASRG